MAVFNYKVVPDSSSAVWAMPIKIGGVIEVHALRNKRNELRYYSVIQWIDGSRTWRSGTRGWASIEPAQKDATWVANQDR